MEKIVQFNALTHRTERVNVPKKSKNTLSEWVEKFNEDAPKHIEYMLETTDDK